MCKGEIIGFPDDDCYYEVNVLQEVNEAFSSREEVGFCAVTTRDTVTKRVCHISQKAYLYKKDVLKACISYNIFVRKNTVMFDERLGVGTYFSSGEETDYLYSFIENYRTCGFLLTEQPFIIRLTMQIFLKSINIALDLLHYKKGLDNEA